MTVTFKGTNSQGQPVGAVMVLDRHQVPVLADDDLIAHQHVGYLFRAAEPGLEQVAPAPPDRPDAGQPVAHEDRLPGAVDEPVPADLLDVGQITVVHGGSLSQARPRRA